MSTNYHQQRPQTRTREYDVGLWNDRGSLLPVAGYIKGPASGQTVSFIDRTIHEALLSDQLAWVHNLRASNSISVAFTSQNRIVDHCGFLWGLHFSDSPLDEHFDGRQERKSTKSPPPPRRSKLPPWRTERTKQTSLTRRGASNKTIRSDTLLNVQWPLFPDKIVFHITFFYFKATNSVHFCSVTHTSNKMRYFYYLELNTIYNLSHWYITNCLQFL